MGEGLRHNEGKNMIGLIPPFAREAIGLIMTQGALKYEPRNWEKGMSWTSILNSLERHLNAFKAGEDFDEETGAPHIAHVAVNAMFLVEYMKIHPQGDDRPHIYTTLPKIGLDVDEVLADFVGKWSETFKVETPEFWNFDSNIKEKFDKLKNDKDWWMSIKPKRDPSALPFEPHCYITSRVIPNKWTEEWISKNGFPTMPVYTVGHDQSKVEVCKEVGVDIFVDDRYENFLELNREGICCFLMSAKHNERYDVGFKRIKDLSDLVTGRHLSK